MKNINSHFLFAGKPLPNPLEYHVIVSLGGDIIVIGGNGPNGRSDDIYKLSCSDGECEWTTMDQKLQKPRTSMVAMVVPDDFFDCQ